MNRGDRQQGVALLTVLFILVLLATLVVYLVEEDQLAVRRTANQQDSEQGFHAALYAEQWLRKTLEADIRDNRVDHLEESWHTDVPDPGEEETPPLETTVSDLQGRFNLNNLASGRDEVWYPAFQRLLAVLELDVGLADAVVDWVDGDLDVSGHAGAEDPYYQLRTPAYRAANRMIAEVGELAWVRGLTKEAIELLRPHVTALPATGVAINVNTATPQVLRILSPDILNAGAVQALVDGRADQGYQSIDAFLTMTVLAGFADTVEPMISVNSEYFEVRSEVKLGRYGTVLYSIVHRIEAVMQANVIQRRRGVS